MLGRQVERGKEPLDDLGLCDLGDDLRIPHVEDATVRPTVRLDDPALSTLFVAAVDATQDAIYSALAAAETMRGTRGHTALAVPRSAFDEPGQ